MSAPRRLRSILLSTALVIVATAVWPLAADAATYDILVSASTTRSAATPLQGKTVSGTIYVFVSPETGITQVRFYLDDPQRTRTPIRVENLAPFDFAGTGGNGAASPYGTTALANGQHTITAAIDRSGGTDVVTSTFTVANNVPPPPPPSGYSLQVSSAADRSSPTPVQGKTLTGTIYVFVSPATGVTQVRFWLDNPQMTGTPRQTENTAPWDFAGTAANGTANPFNAAQLSGQHSITAAVTRSGGTDVLTSTFTAGTSSGTVCSPVPCSQVKVALPYVLDFGQDHGKILDKNGVGTGFTWIDKPTSGTGYIPANLMTGTGTLQITTTAGIQYLTSNSLDNGLAVGIDAPSQVSLISTTLVNVPAGTGAGEQAGLWFGVDEKNYVKLVVVSTSTGPQIQYYMEVADATSGSTVNTANVSLTDPIGLSLRADPSDRSITAKYRIGTNDEVTAGVFTAPGEFFSFDAAGIDPAIGTRSFGGVFASHRNGPASLTYSFDDFSVTAVAGPPPPPPPGGVQFTRVSFAVPNPTSMAWGPDNRLYVSEIFGTIHAFTLNLSGQPTADQVITTLGSRLTLGLTIDPLSTPNNVILWVSHSNPSTSAGQANSGIISRLQGPGFATRTDVITGLPRAIANHATNSIHFGPDGKLYIAQGGNTGAGAPNTANTEFGTMAEQPLSAALLVADVRNPTFDGSCNNTSDIFGPPPCDVQVYSSGLRNMYDFVFHSNGSIYGPDNGLGVTGSYPPRPTPPCTGFGDTRLWTQGGNNPGEQPDLFQRLQPGKYYGHPNPYRNECVFKDGSYQGVSPLPNYQPPMYNLGAHKSADGAIEYKADAFCGALKNNVLLTNYSVGDDVTALRISSDGLSVASSSSIAGGFNDPLPLAQGPDGTIYVGENSGSKVTELVPAPLGCWRGRQPLPLQLLDAGGAALGGKLYVVAGKTASAHQSKVYVFDPGTNQWSSAPDLPGVGVENPAVVALAGKLYVFGGGTDAFSGAVTNAAAFDPATSTWTVLAPMPTARQGPGAGAIGTKIYVAGGMAGNGASLTTLEVYDPATNSWTTAAPMGTPRDNPGSTALGGKLYVFGGRIRNADGSTTNGTLATVEAYDPATNTWTGRASMPTGRRTSIVGTLNGHAQVMGGEIMSNGGAFGANEEYDPVTNTWRTLPSLPTPRHGAASGTINGVIYVVGGGPVGGTAFTDVNEAFDF